MTTIEYSEMDDAFYFVCHDCGAEGDLWDHEHDAELDAERHGQLHDEEPAHADYPHEPGTLYDCPACEAVCHCDQSSTCVHCVITAEGNP